MQIKRINFNLHDIRESLRIRERHNRVCRNLIKEAELEYYLFQCKILKLWDDLTFITSEKCRDHAKKSMLFGNKGVYSTSAPTSRRRKSQDKFKRERRKATWKNVAALELEGIHWGRLLVMRYHEHEELKRATAGLLKLQRDCSLQREGLCKDKRKIIKDVRLVGGVIGDQLPATEACVF